MQVLLPERLVEAELRLQLGMALGGDAALADQELDRIARDQPDQRERDDGHPEEGRDQDAEPGNQKAQHRLADPNDQEPRNAMTGTPGGQELPAPQAKLRPLQIHRRPALIHSNRRASQRCAGHG